MKRAGFARKPPPERPRPPIVPVVRCGVVRRVSDEVTVFPKDEPFRSESYRRYVAQQECFACGAVGYSQCAHPNFGKALAMKTDDRLCFPLCGPRPFNMGCHSMHDLSVEMSRDERRAIEAKYTARMQARAKADGRPEFKEAA